MEEEQNQLSGKLHASSQASQGERGQARIENDHAEDTASREECNDQRRVENDNAEDAARRVKDNLVKKLRKRRLVQEQREAFQSRADKLLASPPEDLRRLCLSTFHID